MAGIEKIVSGLNPEQREAVEHSEGPLLVLAGAGSGKTRMLTHRIAWLIGSGRARPHEILAVTFTNKAAREMRERVYGLVESGTRGVWVATFHSTCVRILRRDISHLGYESNFVIYDQADSLQLVKRVLRGMKINEKAYPPAGVRAQIDRLKNRGLLPADLASIDALQAQQIGEIYQRYQTELRRSNALDFGDLILLVTRLFQSYSGVLASYQQRWRYVLVDEYQDTNPIQYQFLRLLTADHHNLCVVGDEDQSIYAFREADIRNILDFERDFPGAGVIRLERNYRSTQAILDAASAVVANNVERKGKRLYTERTGGEPVRFYQAADERGEAAYVVGELLRLRQAGTPLNQSAIFYRTHAQSRPLEEELLKYNVPYAVVGGTRFYDRAEVKDALAYLRVLSNADDAESLLRIINRPTRGIGRGTVERIVALARENESSVWDALARARDEQLLRGAPARSVERFIELFEELRAHAFGDSVSQLLAHVLDKSGYLQRLEREGTIEAEVRAENLKELLSAIEEFERQNLSDPRETQLDTEERGLLDLFLEEVTLLSEADTVDTEEDRVALMTVHVAKGLEFPNVFLVGMEETLFPHFASLDDPQSLEEERRICYVGMTRAQTRLFLTNAVMRRMHGATRYNEPSRFLTEIPPELISGALPGAARRAPTPRSAAAPLPAPAETSSEDAGITVDYSEGQWGVDQLPPLGAGTRVEHPIFGAGTIADLAGTGESTKIRIRFDRVGMKTIMLKYAQLRLGD
ncbi:MAG: UvrD-helicase domain-containing protein [Myxococcota bacterium]